MKHGRKDRRGAAFWDKEYASGAHLALSRNVSEDLEKFLRWLDRQKDASGPTNGDVALDLGCGNGRNLIHLARERGMTGIGYDISMEAIAQARAGARDLPCTFDVRSLADPLPQADGSIDLVLDMMASHVLDAPHRAVHLEEVARVLRPGGWFFMKTFLLDGDLNAKRMLRDHPAGEPGSYLHPTIGILEHVYTEEELRDALGRDFVIHRTVSSHRHLRHGRAHKRRSIVAYAQRRIAEVKKSAPGGAL